MRSHLTTRPAGLGDWSGLLSQAMTTVSAAAGSRVGASVLTGAASMAADQPLVQVNRARAAALADYGYDQMDRYARWRGVLFAGSATLSAISLAMLYRRYRVPEAALVYTTSAVLNGAVAWFTRPAALRPAPAPIPPAAQVPAPGQEPPSETLQQLLGWIDRRVATLNAQGRGWEARTWRRLAHDLGFGTMEPHVEVLFTRNAQ